MRDAQAIATMIGGLPVTADLTQRQLRRIRKDARAIAKWASTEIKKGTDDANG